MPLLAMQRDTMQGDGRLPALYRQAMRRKGEAPRRAPTLKLSYDCTRKYTGAHHTSLSCVHICLVRAREPVVQCTPML